MKRLGRAVFSRYLVLSLLSTAGMVFAGCSNPPEVDAQATEAARETTVQEAPPREPAVPAPAPAADTKETAPAVKPSDKTATPEIPENLQQRLDFVVASGDFVELNELQQKLKKDESLSKVQSQFNESWDKLAAVLVPRTLIDGMDLLDIAIRSTLPNKCTMYFLFKCTKPLETDYHLTVTTAVEAKYAKYINSTTPGGLYTKRAAMLYKNLTSTWKPGEYQVAEFTFDSEQIPYNVTVGLQTRTKDRKWSGNVGNTVDMGEQVPDEMTSPFVKLAALQREYEESGRPSEAADRTFAERWEALTGVMTPRTLIDGLDLLGVDTRATGEKEYTFSFLLHTTADLDTDYHLTVIGLVNPDDAKYIKPDRPDGRSQSWPLFLFENPTSTWGAGEYRVAQLSIETELIPYNLIVGLQTRDEDRKFTGSPGNRIELGWQTDASNISEFTKLHKLEQEHEALGEPTDTADIAFEERWAALTSGLQPKTLVPGLELLTVETRATGDEEYTFTFLFRTTEDLDADYHLTVTGKVDSSHVQHIKPDKAGASYQSWVVLLYGNPTSTWKAGEYHPINLTIETKLIPYYLTVGLQTRDEQKKWSGNVGHRVELGWQAATQN